MMPFVAAVAAVSGALFLAVWLGLIVGLLWHINPIAPFAFLGLIFALACHLRRGLS